MTVFGDGRRRLSTAVGDPADDTIVERARRGHARAFADLYDRHAPSVYAYLLGQVADPAVAEELLEHVFVEVIPDLVRNRARTWPFEARLMTVAGDVSRRARHSTTSQTAPASQTGETGAEWE